MDSLHKYRTLRLCLTNECNLRCFYCCSEGYRGKYYIFNKGNAYKLISTSFDELNISRVKYTGGEPLMFGDLIDTIQQIEKDYNGSIKQTLVTNGTITDKLLYIMHKMPFVEITLSMPSLDIQTFQKLNKNDTDLFVPIKKSFDELCNNRKSFKINYVLIKDVNDSDKHLNNMFNIVKEYRNINLRFLEPISNDVNKLKDRYLIDSKSFCSRLQNDFGFEIINESRSSIQLKNQVIKIKYIKSFCDANCMTCPSDKTSLWVTPEGKIRKCCYGNMHDQEESIDRWDLASVRRKIKKFM